MERWKETMRQNKYKFLPAAYLRARDHSKIKSIYPGYFSGGFQKNKKHLDNSNPNPNTQGGS